MAGTLKDYNLEIESERKELDSLIQKYKTSVNELVQKLTNIPYHECTNNYNTNANSHTTTKPILCPKDLPICSNYKPNEQMGRCSGFDIKSQIASITASEYSQGCVTGRYVNHPLNKM